MRALLVALTLVVAVHVADAAPKLALTAIDGDDSGDVREAVAEALDGKDLTVIGAKETNRAVDNLKGGVEALTEKQAKKLSTDLEVDAIVYGSLGKDGGNKVLKLRMFVNGKKAKGFSVQFSNPRSKKFKDALRDKMVARVQEKMSDEPDKTDKVDNKKKGKKVAEEDEEEPKAKKGKKGDKTAKGDKKGKKVAAAEEDEEETPKKGKKKKVVATEEDEEETPKKGKKKKVSAAAEEDDDESGEVTVRVKAKSHAANRVAVRLDVGVSASTRSLVFTSTPALRADNQDPKPFKPGPVAGARVEGEVYPLGFSNPKSFAAGLGVAFEYDKVLSSKVQTTLEPGAVGQVNQTHYLFGARYRIPIGQSVTAPSVTVGVGYGRRTFRVKSGGLMLRSDLDLPDTDYKYIAPMLGFRIPFTANVALSATAEAILVSDAGPIVTANEYGQAKVFGFDLEPGLDIVLGNRFALRFAFEMAQIGFTFTGGGAKANGRDMNPDSIDIGGALDRSVGGVVTLGVLY